MKKMHKKMKSAKNDMKNDRFCVFIDEISGIFS